MPYWESDPLVYAIGSDGALYHVDSVPNGSACGCICPSCKQLLVAKNQGTVLIHHFAHRRGACKWAAEASVALLARDILANEGRMFVKGARFRDYIEKQWIRFSPHGWLTVNDVASLQVEGRQAPALSLVCTDADGESFEFLLMAELAQRISTEQLAHLQESGVNVLSLCLCDAYADMRETEGRHFSRRDFYLRVQDPNYLRAALMGEFDPSVLRWQIHMQRDAAEAESMKRYQEKREAESRAAALELEHAMEKLRLDTERKRAQEEQKRAEEERRKAALREQLIEAEKQAFEREGVEALPKVKRGVKFFADGCPLLGQADIVADCGSYTWSPNKCIFFEGERRYFIGCTARQNGIGLDD